MGSAVTAGLLASGYVTNVFVGGALLSGVLDFPTLRFEESGHHDSGTCTFTVIDKTNAVTIRDKAFIHIVDANGTLFKGFVEQRTPTVMAVGRRIDVQARGIESLLDTILVVSNRRPPSGSTPVESDKARLQYLLATYGSQGLYNDNYGSSDPSKIQTLRASMPTQKFKNLTLRQAIESVLAVASDTADYYIDNLGRLHTFDADHPEGDAAPYVVRVGTPVLGELAPEELEIEFDSQGLVNDYQVRAKLRAADVRVADTSSIALYGRYADYIDAPDADTIAKATAVGNAALSDNAAPKVRGSFKVSTPYDLS